MQRMFNLDKWQTIGDGSAIHFAAERPRAVRLELNAEGVSLLYVLRKPLEGSEDAESARFLARVEGRDTVEFVTDGPYSLVCEGAPCAVYTVDGERWSHKEVSPVVFTKIAQRRHRAPELEAIQRHMYVNMERRLAQQADEFRALFERRERAREAQLASEAAAAAAGSSEAAVEPAGDPAGSRGDAGEAGAGRKKKDRASGVS